MILPEGNRGRLLQEILTKTENLPNLKDSVCLDDSTMRSLELDLEATERITELKKDALKLYRSRKIIEALQKLEDAIRLLPGDLELVYYEAMCLFQLGKYERATEIFSQLLRLDEDDQLPGVAKMLAMSLLREKRYEEAEIQIRDMLRHNRNDLQIMNMLAYALERQDKLEEAELTLNRILEKDPKNPNANNSLAFIYYRTGKDLNLALSLVKKALGREQDNPSYLDTMAMILLKKGNVAAARKALNRALQLQPNNEDILAHLVEIGR